MSRFFRDVLGEAGHLKELTIVAVAIGVASGLAAILFYELLNACVHVILGHGAGYVTPKPGLVDELPPPPEKPWLIPLLTALGGLVSGLIVYSLAPETEGHGTDAAIASFHRHAGVVRPRVPLVKMIASSITIGSGGSAGREGPMAQIGAGIGSLVANLLKLDTYKRRVAVAIGIGAGIGTIFKAPLGGAIFGIEVLYKRDFEVEALIPALIASTIGYAIFGLYDGYGHVFTMPRVALTHPLEMAFYAVLGLVCALVGIFYVTAMHRTRDAFRRLPIPNHFKPMIGGLLTGLIGMFFPHVLEMGYGWITLFAHGVYPVAHTGEEWLLELSWEIVVATLLLICLLKILATSFTIGSGGSGGVFAPGLCIGALLGSAMALTFVNLFPEAVVDVEAFVASAVIVGMMALFAGVSKAPIAVLIMVSEMTGGYEIIAPAMISVAISYLLTSKYTIYPEQVVDRAHSPAHMREYHEAVLDGIRVREAMRPEIYSVEVDDAAGDALSVMMRRGLRELPVVENGRLVGRVRFEDLMRLPKSRLERIRVRTVMEKRVIAVTPDDTLHTAVKLMIRHGLQQVPVVDSKDGMRLLGVVTKEDVVEAHDRLIRFILWHEHEE